MAERGTGRIVAISRDMGRTSATDGDGEHIIALMGANNAGTDGRSITAVESFIRVFETNDSGVI